MLPKNSVFFINKVNIKITVNDNSGRGMFDDIVVEPYSSQKLTYECPSVGSCAINFVHNFNTELYDVCICFEEYTNLENPQSFEGFPLYMYFLSKNFEIWRHP